MANIAEFLHSSDHCRIIDFNLDIKLCGIADYAICASIGRGIQTQYITINRSCLKVKIRQWMNLHITHPSDRDQFLLPVEENIHQLKLYFIG